jgi:fatty-acid desaturase
MAVIEMSAGVSNSHHKSATSVRIHTKVRERDVTPWAVGLYEMLQTFW